jgi:hypothetical protein
MINKLHWMSLALLLLANNAVAIPIPGLANTGVNGIGVADSNYTLTSSPSGGTAIGITSIPAWVDAPTGSNWIGVTNGNVTDPIGDYVYQLTFDLTGVSPATFSISGAWATDNNASILLNGVDTGIAKGIIGFTSLSSFSIGSGFISGINTLEFKVTNISGGGLNPTGLLVTSLTGSVPAPAVVFLLTTGLIGIGAATKIRNKGR